MSLGNSSKNAYIEIKGTLKGKNKDEINICDSNLNLQAGDQKNIALKIIGKNDIIAFYNLYQVVEIKNKNKFKLKKYGKF